MEVWITPIAQTELDELPATIHARVIDVLVRLENWPKVSGVKRLTGGYRGMARIRTGDYRVLFRVFDERGVIQIERVAHRREVYD